MTRPRSGGLVPLVMLLVLGGCADVPEDRIERAYVAQERAEAAGASEYAAEGSARLLAYRTALDTELDVQARRMKIFRSYGRASEAADSLWLMAEAVTMMAGERQAAYRMEAESLFNDGAQAARDLSRDLARAPARRLSEAAELQGGVAAAEAALSEARAAYDAHRYREARDLAAEAVHNLYELRASLDQALERQGDR